MSVRPAGVTVSAVMVVLGSVFTLLIGGLMVFGLSTAPPAEVTGLMPVMIVIAAVFAALSGLGTWTGVGLFRMRRWARMSLLVFSGFMAAGSLLAAIAMALVPLPPPGVDPSLAAIPPPARAFLVGLYLVPAALGAAWLVYFNMPATKAAFTADGPVEPPARPLSVSIIGWWMVVSGASCIIPAAIRMPAFLAGAVVTGWSASAVYLAFLGINVWLGRELLLLRERGRLLTLGWFGLSVIHSALMALWPGQMDRALDAFASMGPVVQAGEQQALNASFAYLGLGGAVVLFGLMSWFLVRERAAFSAAGSRADSSAAG